jgi:hypothetical protein
MQDLATAIDALVRASCTSAEIGGIPAPAQFESWLNRCVIPSVLVRLQFLEKKNAGTH